MRFWSLVAGALALVSASATASADVKIINDPTRLDWDYYGRGYKLKPIRDPAIPGGGAAVEINVRKGANPYEAGTNIPIGPITKGRDYVLRIWARTVSASTKDKQGRILVRFFRNADPYPGFGDTTLLIGPEWKAYEVSARASMDIKETAGVGLQLADATQIIQVGQAVVAEGATTLAHIGQPPSTGTGDPIPPQIASKGELINDPLNRNWVFYGAPQTNAATTTDVYTRRGVLLSVASAGSNSWDAGTNVPIAKPIKSGDRLIVAMLARAKSAATEDGLGLVQLRIQSNQAPYNGFGAGQIKLTSNWRLYQWQTTSEMDLPANGAEVAIHTGLAKQEVEIGPVYVIRQPASN